MVSTSSTVTPAARPVRGARRLLAAFLVVIAAALAGCVFMIGDENEPLGTEFEPAPDGRTSDTLVVVLPGVVDNDETLKKRNIHQAIQEAWPAADVMLVGATYPYYRHNTLVSRLHDEVIAPSQKRYRHVWLVGGSLGGLGAMMYEHDYPGEVTGLVLFAPWLGDSGVIEEIRKAGGLAAWDPGRLPKRIDGEHFHRQVWRMVRDWGRHPSRARRVWLACGSDDFRMIDAARMVAAQLPEGHYMERPGGHNWDFWHATAGDLFRRVRDSLTVAGRPR